MRRYVVGISSLLLGFPFIVMAFEARAAGGEKRREEILENLANDWKRYVMIVVSRNWEASFVHMQKSLEYVPVASSK
jgi:hypothetical protein